MILVLLAYGTIFFTHVPVLIKKRYWRELIAFLAFFLLAFSLSVLYALDIKIPSHYEAIGHLIEDVWKLKY